MLTLHKLALGLSGLGVVTTFAGCRHQLAARPLGEAVSTETGRQLSADYDIQRIHIASFDGTKLAANVYIPSAVDAPGPRPTLLLINSWAQNQYEYEIQARSFASDGYIVMSYVSRGFFSSEGLVEVGGSDDMQDATAMIDWLMQNTNCDVTNVGVGGISYGGGLALLIAAHDPRVKMVMALAGWGNLRSALYGGDTMREFWIQVLQNVGEVTSRMEPTAAHQLVDMRQHNQMDKVYEWAQAHSPVTYIKALNDRKVAVFLANSFEDDLFPPGQLVPFYKALLGPKMFYMDHGIHTLSVWPGLLGIHDELWTNVHDWADQWLRGINTGILARGPVSFSGPGGREYYETFPGDHAESLTHVQLAPLNPLHTSSSNGTPHAVIEFTGGIDSGASTGVPILGQALASVLDRPVTSSLAAISQAHAAVFLSANLAQDLHLRGAPLVSVPLTGYSGALQLVAYLYDVDKDDAAALISYGVISHYEGNLLPSSDDIELKIMSYDIPAGHRVALIFDTVDVLYLTITVGPYPVSIDHEAGRATQLTLPIGDGLGQTLKIGSNVIDRNPPEL